jgi:hypothetical protein
MSKEGLPIMPPRTTFEQSIKLFIIWQIENSSKKTSDYAIIFLPKFDISATKLTLL